MILTPRSDTWPASRIKPKTNIRTVIVDDGIREMHQSILANGLLQPLGVLDRPEDNLLFGFRRFAAIGLGGIETVRVSVYPADISASQAQGIKLIENLHRLDLDDPQIYLGCKELMALNPEWQRKDLATHLGKDPSVATKYLCPSTLIPAAFEAFMRGEFGFSKAYIIAKSPDQEATLALTLGGLKRDDLQGQTRKPRTASSTPTARAGQIKCPLVNGQVVTVKGDEISLDEAIDALKEASRAMSKARDQGLDARTFQHVMRDLAAAGC